MARVTLRLDYTSHLFHVNDSHISLTCAFHIKTYVFANIYIFDAVANVAHKIYNQ